MSPRPTAASSVTCANTLQPYEIRTLATQDSCDPGLCETDLCRRDPV